MPTIFYRYRRTAFLAEANANTLPIRRCACSQTMPIRWVLLNRNKTCAANSVVRYSPNIVEAPALHCILLPYVKYIRSYPHWTRQSWILLVSTQSTHFFWMYLNTRGEDPKEHSVKQELERVQRYMKRLQEVADKEKAPRINKDASKRFIRSALWQQAHKEAQKQSGDEAETTSKSTPRKDVITVDSDSDSGVPATKKTRQTPPTGRRQMPPSGSRHTPPSGRRHRKKDRNQ
ncbi:Nuclear nucleic acid-binding protein C1D [Lamellibrachia satsuma]|nr:Nuclear nucleic acid-binding protein C1D [Lamellibrachia satsuma]